MPGLNPFGWPYFGQGYAGEEEAAGVTYEKTGTAIANGVSAFPALEQITTGSKSENPTTLTLPGDIDPGDLILIFFEGSGGGGAGFTVLTGGYTDLGSTGGVYLYGKIANGSETTFQYETWNATTGNSTYWIAISKSAHFSSLPAVASQSFGGTVSIDPPSLNPAGWDVENTLWLALSRPAQSSGVPSGYTLYAHDGGFSIRGKESAVASENPSTYTIGAPQDAWAFTVAIRPDAVPGFQAFGTSDYEVIYSKSGTAILGFSASGADVSEFSRSGVGLAEFTTSGFNDQPSLYTKEGTGLVSFAASGDKDLVAARAGTGTAGFVASGSFSRTFAKTGAGLSDFVVSGIFTRTSEKTGAAVSVFYASGTWTSEAETSGAGIAGFTASGVRNAQRSVAGTGFASFGARGVWTAGNDDFADRVLLVGSSGAQAGNLLAFTSEVSEPVTYYWWQTETATGWYEWVCPSTGIYYFGINATATLDMQMSFYTGSTLATLTRVVAVEDSLYPGGEPGLAFQATVGTSYKIQLGTNDLSEATATTFTLEWGPYTLATNGTFATAMDITGGGTSFALVANNFGLPTTLEPGAPDFPSYEEILDDTGDPDLVVGRMVWFKFTPASTTLYDFVFDTPLSIVVGIFEGDSLASLVPLEEEDGWGLLKAIYGHEDDFLEVPLAGGETYYIAVASIADSVNGDFTPYLNQLPQGEVSLEWTAAPVGNDNFEDVNAVTGDDDNVGNLQWQLMFFPPYENQEAEYFYTQDWPAGGCRVSSNVGATAQVDEPAILGFGPERTVWFRLATPGLEPGSYKIWIEPAGANPTVDPLLAVYEHANTLVDLDPPIAADDNSGPGLYPEVTVTLQDYATYYFQVDARDEGDFEINWQWQPTGPTPPNDDFANATVIAPGAPLIGTTENSTIECGEQPVMDDWGGPYNSVWYTFTPTEDGPVMAQLTVPVGASQFDEQLLEVYEGASLDTLVPLHYTSIDEGTSVAVQVIGHAGVPIYLRVSSYDIDFAAHNVSIFSESEVPPIGDDDDDPIIIPPSDPPGSGVVVPPGDSEGSTPEPGEPDPFQPGPLDPDAGSVWHKYTATAPGFIDVWVTRPTDAQEWYEVGVWEEAATKAERILLRTRDRPPRRVSGTPLYGATAAHYEVRQGQTYLMQVVRGPEQTWGPFQLHIEEYLETVEWVLSGTAGDPELPGGDLAPQTYNPGGGGQNARYCVAGLPEISPGVFSDGSYTYDANGLSFDRPDTYVAGLKPADQMDGRGACDPYDNFPPWPEGSIQPPIQTGFTSITGSPSIEGGAMVCSGAEMYGTFDAGEAPPIWNREFRVHLAVENLTGRNLVRHYGGAAFEIPSNFNLRLGLLRIRDLDDTHMFSMHLQPAGNGENYLAFGDSVGSGETPIPVSLGARENDDSGPIEIELRFICDNTLNYEGIGTENTWYLNTVTVDGRQHTINRAVALKRPRYFDFGYWRYSTMPDRTTVVLEEIETWTTRFSQMAVTNIVPKPEYDYIGDPLKVIAFDGFAQGQSPDHSSLSFVHNVTGIASDYLPVVASPFGLGYAVHASNPGTQFNLRYDGQWGHRRWYGFWFYATEFPSTGVIISGYGPAGAQAGSVFSDLARLTVRQFGEDSEIGELRLTPYVYPDFCVAHLEAGTAYWIELHVNAEVMWDVHVEVFINGELIKNKDAPKGFFSNKITWAKRFAGTPSGEVEGGAYATSRHWAYPSLGFGTNTSFAHDWHMTGFVCGRGDPGAQIGALTSTAVGGVDDEGTHNLPAIPAEKYELPGVRSGGSVLEEAAWTVFGWTEDFSAETDYPNVQEGPLSFDVTSSMSMGLIQSFLGADGDRHFQWIPNSGVGGPLGDQTLFYGLFSGTGSFNAAQDFDPGALGGSDEFIYSGVTPALSGTPQKYWAATEAYWNWPLLSTGGWPRPDWGGEGQSCHGDGWIIIANPYVYPRFAYSTDNGASWTRIELGDGASAAMIAADVSEPNTQAVYTDTTGALKRLQVNTSAILLGFFGGGQATMHHGNWVQRRFWYVEYTMPPADEAGVETPPGGEQIPGLAPQTYNPGSRGQDARYCLDGFPQSGGVYTDGTYTYDSNGLSFDRPNVFIPGLLPSDQMNGRGPCEPYDFEDEDGGSGPAADAPIRAVNFWARFAGMHGPPKAPGYAGSLRAHYAFPGGSSKRIGTLSCDSNGSGGSSDLATCGRRVVTRAPDGGLWSRAKFDEVRLRMGFHNAVAETRDYNLEGTFSVQSIQTNGAAVRAVAAEFLVPTGFGPAALPCEGPKYGVNIKKKK